MGGVDKTLPFPVELIIWRDAWYNDRATRVRDVLDIEWAALASAGWVVAENDDEVVMALEWNANDESARHVTGIPKATILSRRVLRKGKCQQASE